MINKWILNNFKSIEGDKDLELPFRKLTIFTGANSSGKSTILQSILLVTQTLQNQMASRSIVLNGWFKKFGSYSDIVSQRKSEKKIKIGFNLTNENTETEDYFNPYDGKISNVECSFAVFSNKTEGEDLQPKLDNLHLRVKMEDEKDSTLELTRAIQPEKVLKIIESTSANIDEEDLNFKVSASNFRSRYGYVERNINLFGVTLSHFLPRFIMGYYSRKERCKMFVPELLMSRGGLRELSPSDRRFLQSIVEKRCVEIAIEIAQKNPTNKKIQAQLKKIQEDFGFSIFQDFMYRSGVDANQKQVYAEEFIKLVSSAEDSYGLERIPSFFFPGIEYVKNFFGSCINYLGPLREEPKSLYPLQDTGSIIDIGLKGEHTAAVFENNKYNMVPFIDPECFDHPEHLDFDKRMVPLNVAINTWLVYLGVATSMNTDENSKFGHELKIQTDTDIQQDLTHVGVGVSQVLPILVQSFLAQPGSVILLEQPELHLHPKVQTRLADFFVTMNALNKQCIIETHSEYLINRLRHLMAASETSDLSDNTMIYFVEKENGKSNYRQVNINKYGIIEDWPKGFFDESERAAMEILRASMAKKSKEDNDTYEE